MSKAVFTSPQEVEDAFYDAFARADLEAMMVVWSEDEEVICIHPGAPRVVGLANPGSTQAVSCGFAWACTAPWAIPGRAPEARAPPGTRAAPEAGGDEGSRAARSSPGGGTAQLAAASGATGA